VSGESRGWQGGLFWAGLTGLLVFGTRRLAQQRRWDRLALVGGTIIATIGFHSVAGSRVLEGTFRYGAFLILPVTLSVACLIEAVLNHPAGVEAEADRRFRFACVVLLGWGLLYAAKRNWFDPRTQGSQESLWTLRSELRDTHQTVLSLVKRDRPDPGPGIIVAQHWWNEWPLDYYASGRKEVRVLSYALPQPDFLGMRRRLVEKMEQGAYAVCYAREYATDYKFGHVEENLLASFPPERLKKWDLRRQGKPWIVLYRLKREDELPAVIGRTEGGDRGVAPVLRR
ncbi:MAG: hypothetical protein IRY99_14585, partial [Isosphaeraceae bacterium]|nr:hypothetical protein [Isosphaeraceae bacterium]